MAPPRKQAARRPVVPNYTPQVWRRRLHQVVLALYVAAVVGSVGIVGGAFINDLEIEGDPGRALGTVTDVGILRTTVDFQDSEGIYHTPPTGLLYPTGLGEGQQVWVTYARHDPDLVKVEGRMWTLSIIPALSIVVVATLIAGGLWWLVSFLARRAETERGGTERGGTERAGAERGGAGRGKH